MRKTITLMFSILIILGFVSNVSAEGYNLGTVTLKNGSRGEAVMELQRFLNENLNLGLTIDGKLGPKTISVIKRWQKENGLKDDGLIGAKTKLIMNTKKTPIYQNTGICGENGEFCPGTPAYEARVRQETNHTCKVSSEPVMVIISPNEGQTYSASEPVTIKWATCSSVENVYIGLANGGHDNGLISEKAVNASLGSYQWTAPSAPSQNYKISISSSVAPYTQKIVNFKVK